MREEWRDKDFIPRSTEFRWSVFVGPITKVHHIDEGYAWVPKPRDFIEDPSKEFGKSKVPGFESFLPMFLSSKR